MFIIKDYYFFYIENALSINLNLIKRTNKIIIIYRNNAIKETISSLIRFKKKCKQKKIKFFIANDYDVAKKCKADGLYISAYNKKIYRNINVIGSAHNFKEIQSKIKQGCKTIIFSRLFKTNYKNKKISYGIVKFNLMSLNYKIKLIPLGGINKANLLKLNLVKSEGFAILSEVKKKPAISSRLF